MKQFLFEIVETQTKVIEAENIEEAQTKMDKIVDEDAGLLGLEFEGLDVTCIGIIENGEVKDL